MVVQHPTHRLKYSLQLVDTMRRHRPQTVKAYWYNGRANFGDLLAPYLIDKFTGFKAEWERVGKSEVISIGSILEHVPMFYDGYLLGTGRLYPDSRLSLYTNSLTALALRGPLSAKAWPQDVAIGDPGLLASELVSPQPKLYDLGIVPHWSDNKLAMDKRFYSPRWTTKVIWTHDEPLNVVELIGQCKKIVASSLHGIIVADSFGIPRRFEYTPRFDAEGGQFKFDDYSAGIGAKLIVGETYLPNHRTIGSRKHELWDAYRTLDNLLRSR